MRHGHHCSPETRGRVTLRDATSASAMSRAAYDYHQRARLRLARHRRTLSDRLLKTTLTSQRRIGRESRPAVPVLLLAPPSRRLGRGAGAAGAASRARARQPFLGGVPTGTATAEPIAADDRRRHQPRARAQPRRCCSRKNGVGRAGGARWKALSDLLPNVSGRVTETRQVVNLEAFGFPLPDRHSAASSARSTCSTRASSCRSRSSTSTRSTTRAPSSTTRGRASTATRARAISSCWSPPMPICRRWRARARRSAQAQVRDGPGALQAGDESEAGGLVAGIDVLRAEVQLSTERQRATARRNDFEKAKLQLARVIGLPLGQAFTLVDELPSVPTPDMTLEEALDRAYKTRPDYLAALERVQAAEAGARGHRRRESLPSVHVNADYGAIGLTPSRRARHLHRRRRGERADLRGRTTQGPAARGRRRPAQPPGRSRGPARPASTTTSGRRSSICRPPANSCRSPRAARELAAQQLTQARDRFAAGVASNIEVVQAQEAVALAERAVHRGALRLQRREGLLARGLGVAEEAVRQYLGGIR